MPDPGASAAAAGPPVRIAVVGVGHLGKHHARLLSNNPDCHLVALADPREDSLRTAVEVCAGTPALHTDYRDLAGQVDAVCVAAPTRLHREIAGWFLERDTDVLVEKPITSSSAQAAELVDLARRHDRVLMVGHVERYNPAVRSIHRLGIEPRYIESHRMGGITFRSMDVGVVLDLMIHDLDLVLALIPSEVSSVDAFGGALFTPAEDVASAIVKFENGAVAHLTASRVALQPMRRMRLFSPSAYVRLDFTAAEGLVVRKNEGWDLQKLDLDSIDPVGVGDLTKYVFEGLLSVEQLKLDEGNPLDEELREFLSCVRTRGRPQVAGEEGLAAVALAERILESIRSHPW